MYYQNYEDYMRTVLGYPIESQDTYESYNFTAMPYENQDYLTSNNYRNEIEDLYPDIYKLINPMVCKICEANTRPITKELIDQMTEEIYLNIESVPEIDTVVNIRASIPRENKEVTSNKEKETKTVSTTKSYNPKISPQNRNEVTTVKSSTESKEILEERKDRQRIPNRTLQDLIRILILNQLLSGNRPPRPPFPRPGFNPSPMPPRPPIRPPFPREDQNYFNF